MQMSLVSHRSAEGRGILTSHDFFDDPAYDGRELEADLFVAQALSKGASLTANFWNMASEFVEQEYRLLVKELDTLGKVTEVEARQERFFGLRYAIELDYSTYRMPLLVRILRILDVLTQQTPGLDSTGHFQQVRENVTLVKAETDRALRIAILSAFPLVVLVSLITIYRVTSGRWK